MLGLINSLDGQYREGLEGIGRMTISLMENPIFHLVKDSEALGPVCAGR